MKEINSLNSGEASSEMAMGLPSEYVSYIKTSGRIAGKNTAKPVKSNNNNK